MALTGRDLQRMWQSYHAWIVAAVTGVVIGACYGFALRLPFFFDDLPIVTSLNRYDFVQIWAWPEVSRYYRPITYTVYELGLLFPPGTRQVVLHAVPLLTHWANALLVMWVVELCDGSASRAALAAVLFVVFPFLYLVIPWITALPHPLVTLTVLTATYAGLRAERDRAAKWWGVSLLATALAPLVHENGAMCGLVVAGFVLIQHRFRTSRKALVAITSGVLLNVAAMFLRSQLPNVDQVRLAGLANWRGNTVYFLHGLLYPLGPAIGLLSRQLGWQDLTLVGIATVLGGLLLGTLMFRRRKWRWAGQSLWLWACGALPALTTFRFGDLYVAPRLHALSSVGVVMLWAGAIIELGRLLRSVWSRRLVWGLMAGAILVQSVVFVVRQRALLTALARVYEQVLQAAEDDTKEPLGFVNLPGGLAYPTRTHALISEGIVFVPPYSNVGEFIEVNSTPRVAEWVMFSPVLHETEEVFGFRGEGLTWEEMRQFAVDYRSVWLCSYEDGQYVLKEVGSVTVNTEAPVNPQVRFEDGPVIESASVRKADDGEWAITLTWWTPGSFEGDIFVHVRDRDNRVVAQADGPALGRMVPLWIWQSGDLIRDIRYVKLDDRDGPFIVQVGIHKHDGRLPAFVGNEPAADGAAPVATIVP
jgi:hypothetical protein